MDRQFQILTGQESNLPSDTSKRLYIIDDTHRVILDDYTWFEPSKTKNIYTVETCLEEAKKYSTRTDFKIGNSTAYNN